MEDSVGGNSRRATMLKNTGRRKVDLSVYEERPSSEEDEEGLEKGAAIRQCRPNGGL